MIAIRCSSKEKGMHQLVAAAQRLPCPAMLVRPETAKTARELEWAFYLAKGAFEAKSNISGKVSNEALLFFAREMNFSSALKKTGASDPGDFVLVLEKKMPVVKIKKGLHLSSASVLRLPEWGKKRGHYTEAELAIEEMALSRVKN
jgi:tRNA threonylcarbamoyladenosine modification (KEOPS) complex Cgi121 subunit